MSKSKVQTLVSLISRGGKVVLFLLFGHGIPFLITTSVRVSAQCSNIKRGMWSNLLVDSDIKDFASDKHTDVPADDADKYLVAEEVVWSTDH